MQCPNCRFKNPEGMNFCGRCGSPLPKKCPNCEFENPPDFRICGRCGTRLEGELDLPAYAHRSPKDYTPPFLVERVLKSRQALEGERKLVTVLFADVANFTGIAEKLDPEEVHDIMDGCFEILGREIHGAGGTINQYTGDGVMALFGAPVALEDHVHRACHAALQAQRALNEYAAKLKKRYGIDFRMRMGMNTGPVVVGAIGDNLRLDYTAVGDTTNLAARLQALAQPGKVLVSDRVYRAARDGFKFRRLGRIRVKGKEEAVEAFLLEEELDRSLYEAKRINISHFVDRARELAFLENSYSASKKGGPVVTVITGEAGIGKTSLVQTFLATHSASASLPEQKDFRALWGACKPYGHDMPLHPIIEMFRNYFGTNAPTGSQLHDQSLFPRVGELFSLLEEIRLSKDMAHAAQFNKRELFKHMQEIVIAAAHEKPLVVVIDNVQWLDATTEEFMDYLLHAINDLPLLVVCCGRTKPHEWYKRVEHLEMEVGPLSEEDSSNLLAQVIGTHLLLPQISQTIISKAGGNPLFLVEIGQALIKQELIECDSTKCILKVPLEKITIPDSIQGVMAARLDALPGDLKWLVQLASVIGTEFHHEVLRILADAEDIRGSLEHLMEEGIFERITEDSKATHRFRHLMMREVAYSTLLRRDRRRLHELTGQAMEVVFKRELALHAENLSRHFFHSGNWEKALHYTLMAADQSQRAYACQEALIFVERALKIISSGGAELSRKYLCSVHKKKGILLYCVGKTKEALKAFEAMLFSAREFEDRKAEADALFRLGWISFYLHKPKKCENHLRHAIEMARDLKAKEITVKSTSFLGFLYAVLGKIPRAQPFLVEALEMSRFVEDIEVKAWPVAYMVQYYNWVGELRKALGLCAELRRLNETLKSPNFNILLCFREGLIYGALGQLEDAEKSLNSGLKQLKMGDDQFWRPRFLNTLGWVRAEGGRIEEALELNKEALELAVAIGDPESIHNSRINLAENYMELEEFGLAEEHLSQSLEHVRRPGLYYTRWRYKTRLFITLAELHRKLQRPEKAIHYANQALRLARNSNAKKHEARALMVKGLIQMGSRPKSGIKLLERAYNLAREMEAGILMERLELLLKNSNSKINNT